ncbi:MAG: DUF4845 domain-containing protein [Betaproteobacteria bacterium]
MRLQRHSRQSGISLISMLIVGVVLAAVGVVAAEVFPTALEYFAVVKAVNKAREGDTLREIRALFDKAAAVDSITSISGKDLDISKESDKVVVAFSYQREIHLAGPAWLTLKYAGRSK